MLPLVVLLGCTPVGSQPAPLLDGDAATDSGTSDASTSTGSDASDSKSDGAVTEPRGGAGGKGGKGGATAGEGEGEGEGEGGAGAAASSGSGGASGNGTGPAGAGAPVSGAGGESSLPMAGASGGPAQPMGPCPDGAMPTDEACDDKDNNCDGKVDEGLTRSCGPEAKGECKPGTETCAAGTWSTCTGATEPKAEVCDEQSLDENCDGTHNEGCTCIDGSTQPCGKNTGLCRAGAQTCEGGKWSTTCKGAVDPMLAEVCDQPMVDENCDGRMNEGCDCVTGVSEDCMSAALGPCKPGKRTCNSGKWGVCTSTVKASAELCDGVDNNCDGTPDNSVTNCMANESCVSGICKCTPQCSGGKTCGPDGCGGRCQPDACPAGQACSAAGKCASTCGNSVEDPGEGCDDGVNAESGDCPHCQGAFCGDGFIRAGIEECEQNAPGWNSDTCSPDCKRNVYKKCDASISDVCSGEGINSNCAAWVGGTDVSTYVCGPYCETSATCPKPGGYDAHCAYAYCALLCKDGMCPTGMRCARNVPLGINPEVVNKDVCIGG